MVCFNLRLIVNSRRKSAGNFFPSGISLLLLAVLMSHCTVKEGSAPRERISINEGWRFFKYDSVENADKLVYDVRPDIIEHRPLRCQVLKVPHHMSKHGISLEVLETLNPRYTIASCSNQSKHGFPHELTVMAAKDIRKKKKDHGMRFTGHRDTEKRSGTVMALFREKARRPLVYSLGEPVSKPAPFPELN